MTDNGPQERRGRETRLLVLVVAVSLALLLVLARFRFPSSDLSVVTPSAAPLAGLTSRASFEELGTTMADVVSRASGAIAIVKLAPDDKAQPRTERPESAAAAGPAPSAARWLPALRVGGDTALLQVPVGWTVSSGLNLDGTPTVASIDDATRVALIHAPSATAFPDGLSGAVTDYAGMSYLAAVSATPGGPDVRPVFVGRVDALADGAWPQSVLRVPATSLLQDGDLLFSVGGRFVGLSVGQGENSRIVTAATLQTLATSLSARGVAGR